jgi:hypothetical protein
MRWLEVNFENALTYIKAKQSKINLNEGFIRQLRTYESDFGLTNNKRSIDLEEMKENICVNATKPKISDIMQVYIKRSIPKSHRRSII